MTRARALLSGVGVVLLTSACQGGDDGGLATGDDFSVVAALEEIPAEVAGDAVHISTADLDAACEANACQRPSGADDEEAVRDWISALTGGPAAPEGPVIVRLPESLAARSGTMSDLRVQLGWSLVDVGSYVSYEVPPGAFTVVSGPDSLSEDLVEIDDGVLSTSDAEEGHVDPSAVSPVDRLGRPVRLAQDEDRVALSLSASEVAAWSDGPEATLADDQTLRALATAMDGAEVASAVLAREDFAVLDQGGGAEVTHLPPFESVALGWTAGDDAEITVAYGTGSDQDAETLATALQGMFDEDVLTMRSRSPLSEYLVLDRVTAEGSLATATLRPAAGGFPMTVLQMLEVRDVLFSHR